MNKTSVISHRGNFLPEGPIPTIKKYDIPENTLEAFKRAFQNGWGIETDVRRAGDEQFVIIHDPDIVRFSGQKGSIREMSVPQIKGFGYIHNTKFKIPTLEELCTLAKNSGPTPNPIFIAFQLKPGDDLSVGRAIAKEIDNSNLENCILFDATIEVATRLREEFQNINLSVSVGEENYSPTIYKPDQVLTEQFTSVYTSIWADEWKIQGSIYNEEMFKRLRAAYNGRIDVISPELHYNEGHPKARDLDKLKTLWQEIISWGIANGICTDYPTELQSLI